MTSFADEFQATFDAIVSEHGLVASTDLHIAHALCRVMLDTSADPVKGAEAIARLKALLPEARAEAPVDISKLSDAEVDLFEKLIAKAKGQPVEHAIPTLALEFINPHRDADLAELAKLRTENSVLIGRVDILERMLASAAAGTSASTAAADETRKDSPQCEKFRAPATAL